MLVIDDGMSGWSRPWFAAIRAVFLRCQKLPHLGDLGVLGGDDRQAGLGLGHHHGALVMGDHAGEDILRRGDGGGHRRIAAELTSAASPGRPVSLMTNSAPASLRMGSRL